MNNDISSFCVALVLAFIIMMILTGCAKPQPITITKYIEVAVPVKCEVILPSRPSPDDDIVTVINSILLYTERLEILINYCTGDSYGENDRGTIKEDVR